VESWEPSLRGGTGHFVDGPELQQCEQDPAEMMVEKSFLGSGRSDFCPHHTCTHTGS